MLDLSEALGTGAVLPAAGKPEVGMPYRQVGGTLQYDQIRVWQAEGLPAYCPVCERGWKFIWSDPLQDWRCPHFDDKCWVFVKLETIISEGLDGGVFWCAAHEGCWPHHINMTKAINPVTGNDMDGTVESCKRASKLRVADRQRRRLRDQSCNQDLPPSAQNDLDRE